MATRAGIRIPERRRMATALLVVSAIGAAALAGCTDSGTPASSTSSGAATPGSLVTVAPNSYSAVSVPDSQVQSAIAAADGLAQAMMGKAQVPGMAVAVVHNGKQVYSKGLGVRKVGEAATVDADTVFNWPRCPRRWGRPSSPTR